MKNLILLFAVVVIFPVSAQVTQGKIGYVDVDKVMSMLPEMEELEQRVADTEKNLRADYQTKQEAFRKAYNEYTSAGAGMVDSVRAKVESDLEAMSQELQMFPEDAQKTIQNTRKIVMIPLYLKVGNIINDVAIENGFALIVTRKIGSNDLLLYSNPQVDATDLVLKKLGIATD